MVSSSTSSPDQERGQCQRRRNRRARASRRQVDGSRSRAGPPSSLEKKNDAEGPLRLLEKELRSFRQAVMLKPYRRSASA